MCYTLEVLLVVWKIAQMAFKLIVCNNKFGND